MADLTREDAPEPETASGKRDVDQTVEPQAEPQKRARTSESATEPAAQREEAERPSDSPAGDEAEEVAAPVSRGLALAEKHIQQRADTLRAAGNTQLADAIEATIITNAAQRNAVLVPTHIPAYNANAPLDADQLDHFISSKRAAECRSRGSESAAEVWELLDTDEEIADHNRREAEFSQLLDSLGVAQA